MKLGQAVGSPPLTTPGAGLVGEAGEDSSLVALGSRPAVSGRRLLPEWLKLLPLRGRIGYVDQYMNNRDPSWVDCPCR